MGVNDLLLECVAAVARHDLPRASEREREGEREREKGREGERE